MNYDKGNLLICFSSYIRSFRRQTKNKTAVETMVVSKAKLKKGKRRHGVIIRLSYQPSTIDCMASVTEFYLLPDLEIGSPRYSLTRVPFWLRAFFLACRWPPSFYVLPQPLLCTCVREREISNVPYFWCLTLLLRNLSPIRSRLHIYDLI